LPWTYTSVLAVPRSIARSCENIPAMESKRPIESLCAADCRGCVGFVSANSSRD
jgi:hypothetical protein